MKAINDFQGMTCPQCHQPIEASQRDCPKCGVNIAIAAVLVEQALEVKTITKPLQPVSPELLVPRLGDYLVKKGALNQKTLQKALDYQQQQTTIGKPILLGQALVELNLIDRSTLERAITEQILRYQAALQSANQELEKRVQERTKELQEALVKLTELNQLKSNFIANISHELRTPLAHMKGYLELLADGALGALTPEQNEGLTILQRAYNRLENLIEDLIRYSLYTRGQILLNRKPLDVINLLQSVETQSRVKARQKSIQLNTFVSPELPPVFGDEEKLNWALLHLVDNAIKFTPEGGKVAISAQGNGSIITLAVTDTGIGIPEEHLTEIFEPFHQLDGSSTRHYGGTGLGLSLVRRIVEAHGSKILVRSKVGKGSRFEFDLTSPQK
ncbi:MAG: ATP-binding protein [Chloroflexota bacterium]